jgi:HK97 family phage portal protein
MRRLPGILRRIAKALSFVRVGSSLGWNWVSEAHTGDWQRNITPDSTDSLVKTSPVYACVTGIASDVSKLRIKLSQNNKGIWEEITENQPWLPVLRKPNHYQNRIKFIEQWILSKLLAGNAYVLKQRDGRGIVNAMYVLDPSRVVPLVATDGGVYYQVNQDQLSQVPEQITVPASEVIHDRMACLFHPLVGVPPLYACAMSGTLGRQIQSDSATFFKNRSLPGGMLTAPGSITEPVAERLKKLFESNYSGENLGRLFVAGDGLKFEAMRMTAENAQVAEMLQMSIDDVARAFHYPVHKLNGQVPSAVSAEVLTMAYYTDCLQTLIESLELCLDEGLDLPAGKGTECDLDNLMRMDTSARNKAITDGVGGGWMAPDEGRFIANLKPVPGGSMPYLQQQNYSLEALAKRDAQENPFGAKAPDKPAEPPKDPGDVDDPENDEEKELFGYAWTKKELGCYAN